MLLTAHPWNQHLTRDFEVMAAGAGVKHLAIILTDAAIAGMASLV
ncbi:MAG: hypothetical protein VKJ64_06870 [Leptolyngbyaceae bacterium]|nr:hypothetical protein [Leptolyngbyaceae bacterium]